MKKICLIIHSLGIGGMEMIMHQLAVHFSQRKDAQVHIILFGRNRKVVFPLSESITVHKPSFNFDNSRRIYHTLKTIKYIRSEITTMQPDVILSFGEIWNNLVLLSLYRLQIPIIISDRSQPEKNLGTFHNFLRNKLYPKAAGYIAQTEKAAMICRKNGWNRNIQVIGNPVRNIKTDSSIVKENIVLFVGRLIPTKHIDQLIQMFSEINMPGWKLCIVGGDAKNMKLSIELSQMIKNLNVGDKVLLEGEQLDIDPYYNRSKIFAFTSSSEGFPNVICEAQSAGLPVIAYDCVAGPSDMIDDGTNGFLVPLFDQDMFKRVLRMLMHDGELRNRIALKGQEKVKELDADIIADRYYDFLMKTSHIHHN